MFVKCFGNVCCTHSSQTSPLVTSSSTTTTTTTTTTTITTTTIITITTIMTTTTTTTTTIFTFAHTPTATRKWSARRPVDEMHVFQRTFVVASAQNHVIYDIM